MHSAEFPWKTKRRFNSYSDYFKRETGNRVQKVTIDAGFTCPNRDGSIATGGCSYCNNDAFNPSYCQPEKSITQQIEEGIEFHEKRYRSAVKYLAYFQAYSNTYASLGTLKKIYNEALNHPGVSGLVIGTRPDCIDEEKLEYFGQIATDHYLIIEYGIESCYDRTLQSINRGHSFAECADAIRKTAALGIRIGAHLIIGLPGESKAEILAEASIISQLPINNLKIHQLQIMKNTRMAVEYQDNPDSFQFFTLDEYIDFVIDFIELLNPGIVIERIAGEIPPRFQAGPGWGLIRNEQIITMFDKRLEERNTWQGKKYVNSSSLFRI
ncbi:MAG: TIGR01212 family radical SAM protein [Bacteroidia bacterium]|nr:TIGR01212 family radical SAM protein [Bacteroidia bacterium]